MCFSGNSACAAVRLVCSLLTYQWYAMPHTRLRSASLASVTDALRTLAQERGMMAVRMAGIRFDAGDWSEFLSANIYFALQDEDLRYELLAQLRKFVQFQ